MQSNIILQHEKIYQYLKEKYKRAVISKSEMAKELGISNSTLISTSQKAQACPTIES